MLVSEYLAGMGVNSKLASECRNIKQGYIISGNGAELIKILMGNLKVCELEWLLQFLQRHCVRKEQRAMDFPDESQKNK